MLLCARDQSSIFSTSGKFCPDYGLLLALTLVARSYALLVTDISSCTIFDSIESHGQTVFIPSFFPRLGARLAVFTGHKKYLRHFVNRTGFTRLKMMNIYSYSFSHEIYKLLDAMGFSYKTIIGDTNEELHILYS